MSLGNLLDASSSSEALKAVKALDNLPRTVSFQVNNGSTQFEIVLALCEGYDKGYVPAGFQTDTGLTVTGQNVGPGNFGKAVIQPGINVQVTLGKASCHWRRTIAPYDEGNLNFNDIQAAAGYYYPALTWELIDGHREAGIVTPKAVETLKPKSKPEDK